MKFIRNILDKVGKPFHEGGKLQKFFPVYDALDTFMFTPDKVTSNGTHIRDGIDLKRTMVLVILALVPALLFGMWNIGHQHYLADGELIGLTEGIFTKFLYGAPGVLLLVLVSYAAGLGVEFVFCIKNGHPIQEGFLVSGMLIPLTMPIGCPLWMVAVATIFAVLFVKEVFGGTGMNVVNVALTARAFVFFAYPTKISGNKVWTDVAYDDAGKAVDVAVQYNAGDTISAGAEPIIAAVEGVYNSSDSLVAGVDAYTGETALGNLANATSKMKELKDAVVSSDGAEVIGNLKAEMMDYAAAVPQWTDSLLGNIPGSIGETSVIAVLIGGGILLATQVASWRVMLSFLVGGLVMGLIFNGFADMAGIVIPMADLPAGATADLSIAHPFLSIPAWEHLMLGSFMFGMVFMATDPVTAAQTTKGKWIYGFFAGFFAICIRVFNPAYPEGVMLSILFMNVMAPMIDHYVIAGNIKRREKRWKAKAELAAAH